MNDDRELVAYAQELLAEVQDKVFEGNSSAGGPYSETVFADLVIEQLCELGASENTTVCFYEGSGPHGSVIRLLGYGVNEDEDRLDLFTTIFHDRPPLVPVPRDEIVRAATRGRRAFDAAVAGFHARVEPASEAYEMLARMNSLARGLAEVRVFVLTNGLSAAKKLDPSEVDGKPLKFEIWDVERLFRARRAGLPREEVDIDFKELFGEPLRCLPMPRPMIDYTAYFTVIPGDILVALYEEYGARLLELNVRSFLSITGKVNKGIRKTLSEAPERFVAYNNGIVITVDELVTETLSGGGLGIRSVKGLQIVNGGQTTASIHRARKVDKADISSVFVPAKIILAEQGKLEEMVRLVSRYANSQNVVQVADFSANDPYHVELERLSNVIWCPGGQGRWFYERARGQYQVAKAGEGSTAAALRRFKERTPPQRKFTKTELAKFLNTWEQRPHLVSYGAQKNFEQFMQSLRATERTDWLPDEIYFRHLVAKAILYRVVQRIVRQEEFAAYQANIVTYLVAYLASRTGGRLDFDLIWNSQQISPQLEELLRAWAHEVERILRDSAQGRMVSEWAKKEKCWEVVREASLALPDQLPPELCRLPTKTELAREGGATYAPDVTPTDLANIEACKKVSGEEWLRIHAWGNKTGRLQKWQIGIAHTLAGYAASGWEKGPSPKQARHGMAILKLAREDFSETQT